jgi:hypothetical protein
MSDMTYCGLWRLRLALRARVQKLGFGLADDAGFVGDLSVHR